jgi:hypothetical protein
VDGGADLGDLAMTGRVSLDGLIQCECDHQTDNAEYGGDHLFLHTAVPRETLLVSVSVPAMDGLPSFIRIDE